MMSKLAREAEERICGRCKYHRSGWDEGKGGASGYA